MLLIDLEQGRIVEDEELKADLANAEPYEEWLKAAQYKLKDLDHIEPELSETPEAATSLLERQQAFGYTQEDIARFLEPMARGSEDPIGSMGTDTPIAVLSDRSRLLYDYFKQNFAQVTNPPIDPIREELVMSLLSMIGPRPNLLGATPARTSGSRSASRSLPMKGSPRSVRWRSRSMAHSAPRRSTSPGTPAPGPMASPWRSRKCAGRRPKQCWAMPTS